MKRLLAALLLCLAAPAPAHAHFTTQGYARITQDGNVVTYVLGLESEALFELADGDDRVALSAYLLPRVRVASAGERCAGALKGMTPQRYRDVDYLRLVLEYECASARGPFAIRYAVPAESLAAYELAGASGTFAFDPDHLALEVERPAFAQLDLALVLVLLVLGARRVREPAVFAAAYGAALLAPVGLPFAGPLAAASIVYLAVLLVLGGERRLAVLAVAGLAHGSSAAAPPAAALVLVAAGALALRRLPWAPAVAGSAAAATGLFWLSQRVLGG